MTLSPISPVVLGLSPIRDQIADFLNVMDHPYNAVPDDGSFTIDATTRIQAALDDQKAAAGSVNAPAVYIPSTQHGFLASSLRYYPETAILGSGYRGAQIVQKPGTADFLFKSSDPTVAADEVMIASLYLNGFVNQGSSLGAIDFQKVGKGRAVLLRIGGFAGSSIRFKGGSVGGDTMYGTVTGCVIENMPVGGVAVELQSSASSQPDGTVIFDSVINAAAGRTAFKIVGALSRGADAAVIALCRTIGIDTIIDSDGVTTRVANNRFEVTSGGMSFLWHPSFGATSPGGICSGNTYAYPGSLTWTDSGGNPVKRWGEHYPGNLKTENGGTSTQTPGVTATVNIPHGLVAAPRDFVVQAGDVNARGAPSMYVTADATNIILNFSGNLAGATAYTWRWRAEV